MVRANVAEGVLLRDYGLLENAPFVAAEMNAENLCRKPWSVREAVRLLPDSSDEEEMKKGIRNASGDKRQAAFAVSAAGGLC
jgi:hypothetical protein